MYSQLFLEKSAISDIKGVHFIWVNGREGKGKEREKRIPSNRTRTHPTGKDMYRVPPLKQMRASPPLSHVTSSLVPFIRTPCIDYHKAGVCQLLAIIWQWLQLRTSLPRSTGQKTLLFTLPKWTATLREKSWEQCNSLWQPLWLKSEQEISPFSK
jgi:hypothetical protein